MANSPFRSFLRARSLGSGSRNAHSAEAFPPDLYISADKPEKTPHTALGSLSP